MQRKLVNDNIPALVKGEYGKCKDDKEFYVLLHEKITKNVEKLFSEKDISKKYNAAFDILYDVSVVKTEIDKRYKNPIDRKAQLGGYGQKYIQEPKPVVINDSEIQKVRDWAEKNGYPVLVLQQDGDKTLKQIGEGKESWDKAFAWLDMNEPYRNNFKDVIRAVTMKT